MFYCRVIAAIVLMGFFLGFSGRSQSVEIDRRLEHVIEERIRPILRHPSLVNAIKVQNKRHERLKQQDIVKLDSLYVEEREKEKRPLLDDIMERSLSKELLRIKKKNDGVFTEIFVMDNRGINVAQSDITSDLWQGDEEKWQRTFLLGPHALYIGGFDFDESTGKYQVQVSATVSENGLPLGVATFGIDISKL